MDEVLVLLQPDAASRQVRLGVEVPRTLPPVRGDRVHLQQVLLNLILNGMDAMADVPAEGRRLVVRARLRPLAAAGEEPQHQRADPRETHGIPAGQRPMPDSSGSARCSKPSRPPAQRRGRHCRCDTHGHARAEAAGRFPRPPATGVRAVLVTGKDTPSVASIDELSGKELYVRPSSSYAERLKKLNQRFEAAGKSPVRISPAPEILEDGDILEMVNAGLVPATAVDDFMADLDIQVFPNLRKNSDIASPPGESPGPSGRRARSWRKPSTPS